VRESLNSNSISSRNFFPYKENGDVPFA